MGEPSKFSIVPRVVWQGCQPNEVRVYAALASYADWDTGVCWPSHSTLAEALNVSEATVRRALRGLLQKGVIDVTHRFDGGEQTTNLYRLPFAINQLSTTGGQNRPPGGVKSDQGVGSNLTTRTRTIEREGLTQPKNDPKRCAHKPVDDEGYCTACGSTIGGKE